MATALNSGGPVWAASDVHAQSHPALAYLVIMHMYRGL
jgi:hypothetical protein